MTDNKRFQWSYIKDNTLELRDNGIVKVFNNERLEELLNDLNDENEELRQFQEDVFAKIDMHLRMLPTVRDNEFNEEEGDPSLYTGAIYMLETLKKELQRDD